MKQGDIYRDFEVTNTFRSHSFKGEARLLCHKSTGLRLFHIHNRDAENFFSITFNTPSENSCGTAHILEHSVLCGSRQFPSKTLFADLAAQTTNTFLNAMTYRDHTSFAAGSLIKKDFFTLFKVYADAVFSPLLLPEIFFQEAHRFEVDSGGKISVNGVVYSEMQGEYSDFESVLTEKLLTEFFADSHYGFDSGGDPKEIPKLTHEDLVDFHRRHYNVSNCIIFIYGDIPTKQHLDFIHENILSFYTERGAIFPLKEAAPKQVTHKTAFIHGPASEEEPTAGISFKIDNGANAETFHSLNLLYKLLFDNDSSLLKKHLIDGGFGSDFSPISETQTLNRFIIATFAMRGIPREDFPKYTDFVMKKLAEIAENPIPQDAISIVVNEWEFSLRELSVTPRPVLLFNQAISSLLYSENPFEFLQTKKIFARIKEKIKNDPLFFQKLIKKHLLGNSSSVKFFARGSEEFNEEYCNGERFFCENCGLSTDEIKIRDEKLKFFQGKRDCVSIPHLELADLPKKIPYDYGKTEQKGNFDFFSFETDTNGISYLGAFFSMGSLDKDLLPYMPFFCNAITSTGFGGKNWFDSMKEIYTHTGSFSADCQCNDAKFNRPGTEEPIFTLWASCLNEKVHKTVELMAGCVKTADFSDLSRLGMIFSDYCKEVKSSEFRNQLGLVAKRCNCNFSVEGTVLEIFYGMSQIRFVKDRENISPKELSRILNKIKGQLLDGGVNFLIISGKKGIGDGKTAMEEHFRDFSPYRWGLFATKNPDLSSLIFKNEIGNSEVFENPALTGFSGTAISVLPAYDDRFVYLAALSAFLNRGELWRKIRVKQGAYGVFTGVAVSTGLFWFLTYRDSQPENSFFLLKETLEEFLTTPISSQQILKIIISCVGKKILKKTPASRGVSAYMHTYEEIPKNRHLKLHKMLLKLREEDLKLGAKLLLNAMDKRRTCIFQ